MSGATLQLVVGYLALVGALGVLAAAGIHCVPALRTGIVVAELLLIAQAALDVVAQLRGHHPPETATHLGYLIVSVLLLPLLLARSGWASEAGLALSRSDHLVVIVGCVAAIVVAVRLHATWS